MSPLILFFVGSVVAVIGFTLAVMTGSSLPYLLLVPGVWVASWNLSVLLP